MVTELSHYNLGVTFFVFDCEVISDQFSDNQWILVACVHCLLLISDRLLSHLLRFCEALGILAKFGVHLIAEGAL